MMVPTSNATKNGKDVPLGINPDQEDDTIINRCSFFQIRNNFEEKSKSSSQAQDEVSVVEHIKPISDFQALYPLFKSHYTRHQFSAMENAFNFAGQNHDGYLEPREVKELLVTHQLLINLCDADVIVRIGDKNEDGKLCPREFLELCLPTVENLREEQLKQGAPFLQGKEFVHAILQGIRNLVNPITKKVKGTRQYFENIISGVTTDENVILSGEKSVVNRYMKA